MSLTLLHVTRFMVSAHLQPLALFTSSVSECMCNVLDFKERGILYHFKRWTYVMVKGHHGKIFSVNFNILGDFFLVDTIQNAV